MFSKLVVEILSLYFYHSLNTRHGNKLEIQQYRYSKSQNKQKLAIHVYYVI